MKTESVDRKHPQCETADLLARIRARESGFLLYLRAKCEAGCQIAQFAMASMRSGELGHCLYVRIAFGDFEQWWDSREDVDLRNRVLKAELEHNFPA